MYTGTVIEELMESVERAEQHAYQPHAASDVAPLRVDVRQVRDTFIYNFSYSQEHIGVA
jgi:hypothetical protein